MSVSFRRSACAALLLALTAFNHTLLVQAASAEAEVRDAIEQAFAQLRAGRYSALYDALPAASRRRVTRANFADRLAAARGFYQLDQLEIASIDVEGDAAVAETVVYGRVERPVAAEGKISVQQFLVKEGGRWRVATGDRATASRLLAARPALARRVTVREPRVFVKQGDRWVDLGPLAKLRRSFGK